MRHWFVLSALGKDRPGIVAELAQLIFDCDANLEDSRMTILGSDFAVILLGSASSTASCEQIATAAKRLERENGLMMLVRNLQDEPRSAIPAPGYKLYRLRAAGEDKAGIVAGMSAQLAQMGVNIADLASTSQPGPGGSPYYELCMDIEVPDSLPHDELQDSLQSEADRLVIDLKLEAK